MNIRKIILYSIFCLIYVSAHATSPSVDDLEIEAEEEAAFQEAGVADLEQCEEPKGIKENFDRGVKKIKKFWEEHNVKIKIAIVVAVLYWFYRNDRYERNPQNLGNILAQQIKNMEKVHGPLKDQVGFAQEKKRRELLLTQLAELERIPLWNQPADIQTKKKKLQDEVNSIQDRSRSQLSLIAKIKDSSWIQTVFDKNALVKEKAKALKQILLSLTGKQIKGLVHYMSYEDFPYAGWQTLSDPQGAYIGFFKKEPEPSDYQNLSHSWSETFKFEDEGIALDKLDSLLREFDRRLQDGDYDSISNSEERALLVLTMFDEALARAFKPRKHSGKEGEGTIYGNFFKDSAVIAIKQEEPEQPPLKDPTDLYTVLGLEAKDNPNDRIIRDVYNKLKRDYKLRKADPRFSAALEKLDLAGVVLENEEGRAHYQSLRNRGKNYYEILNDYFADYKNDIYKVLGAVRYADLAKGSSKGIDCRMMTLDELKRCFKEISWLRRYNLQEDLNANAQEAYEVLINISGGSDFTREVYDKLLNFVTGKPLNAKPEHTLDQPLLTLPSQPQQPTVEQIHYENLATICGINAADIPKLRDVLTKHGVTIAKINTWIDAMLQAAGKGGYSPYARSQFYKDQLFILGYKAQVEGPAKEAWNKGDGLMKSIKMALEEVSGKTIDEATWLNYLLELCSEGAHVIYSQGERPPTPGCIIC